MSEWRELTWDEAMRRGYEALRSGEALYEEIDAEPGRSNLDIEKHLRRAELKLAQSQRLVCHGAGAGLATGRLRRSGTLSVAATH